MYAFFVHLCTFIEKKNIHPVYIDRSLNKNRNVTLVWRRKSFMTLEFGRFLINKKIWLFDKTAL